VIVYEGFDALNLANVEFGIASVVGRTLPPRCNESFLLVFADPFLRQFHLAGNMTDEV